MKLYHFTDPHDYNYASAGRLGTWSPDPGPGVCPECGRSRQQRVPPLIVEWLPGSDRVGDFTWPGIDDEVVVAQRVRETLESEASGAKFYPIEMYQPHELKRPMRVTKRTKSRVWLPYEGPPLWDLRPTTWCSLDHNLSGIQLDKVCSTCGRSRYIRPPFEQRHLVIDRSTWCGEGVFLIREYAGWIFCTELVKDLVESRQFTNVSFLVDGEIPDSHR